MKASEASYPSKMGEQTQSLRNKPEASAERMERRLRLLVDTGLLLASERSLSVIVQAALDAGLQLCGASFGAFFYNQTNETEESYQLYKVSGVDPEEFAKFPMPRNTSLFQPTFNGSSIVRSDDVLQNRSYGRNAPHRGMPPGHLPVRSYLAVPVKSRAGEVFGCMLYGHPDPGVFQQECEDLVATVASQAAVAIDNIRLHDAIRAEVAIADSARQLQRRTTQRLQQALEAGALGTWSWDRATDMIDFDERAAAILGVHSSEPFPRRALRLQIIHPDDLAHTPSNLVDRLDLGDSYNSEFRAMLPDGSHRWVSVSGIGIYGSEDSSQIVGLSGTLQDVTARKTQEETLRQSEKLAATGRLAATIAHEINNPLEAVTNLIYLCKTDPEVPESAKQLLETADGELARVAQIAQQTLGFYRDTTRPVRMDLGRLLHSVVELFGRKLTSRKLVCTIDLEPELQIYGLQGEIKQVFSNLLVNAIDASPTGARIRIRARHASRDGRPGVQILFSDEGVGIAKSIRHRMFSPFFTTKEAVGTGLGLWVTKGIVEKHGGSIVFRSSTEFPTGTIFRLFLPLQAPPVPEMRRRTDRPAGSVRVD